MSIRRQIEKRPWILAIGAILVVAAWMYSGSFGEREIAPTATVANTTADQVDGVPRVQVSSQYAEPVVRTIKIYGQTEPARTVEISAETEGRVTAVDALRGRLLRKGDVILRLDMRDRQARLAEAEAGVTEHRTSYDAQMQLKQEGYVSDTQIAETLARLENAKAELTRAKLDLDYRVIRAPFAGVLQEREVEIGDFVREGDPVATFIDNTSIIVSGTIAEGDARYVTLGETGSAKLATGQVIAGKIRYLSSVADASTRTFKVELEVPNPDGLLPAGVTAEMVLPGGQVMAHAISPSLLTLDDAGNVGVKVVDDLNRVEFYAVELAVSTPDGAWVTGLPETAKIITLGQGYVAPGQVVDPAFTVTDTAVAGSERQEESLK